MELAKSGTLNEDMRRRAQSSSAQSDVLITKNRGRNKNKKQRGRGKCRSKPKSRYKNVECHYCGVTGHIQRNCFRRKRALKENKRKEKNTDGENNNERINVTHEDLLFLQDYETVNLAHDETTWVVDSGASVHVTSQSDIFTSYTPGKFGDVRTADHGVIECIGVGEICLETSNGSKMVLKDVKHIPSVRLNLLSVGKLCGEKYDSLFLGDTWKLYKGIMVLARGKQHSNLYITRAKVIRDSANAIELNDRIIEFDDKTELWHRRLSHISEKGLDCLAKKNLLHGVKRAKLEKYAHCFAGKQRRVSFFSQSSRKSDFLQLVHSDVCGPLKVSSLGGALYFVTFIDDYSRKLWVCTLKTKDQVLDVIKQFQVSAERRTGKKLKCIRTNNGGEYTRPFDRYCTEQGIVHQKTPPKTPQLNGMAERMNRTLIERVTCYFLR